MNRRRPVPAPPPPPVETPPPGPVDWWLLFFFLLLLCVGLLAVLSASGPESVKKYHTSYHFFKNQLIFMSIGGIIVTMLCWIPRSFINRLHYWGIGISIVLLALCPVITLLGMIFSKDIVSLMNTAPELAEEASRYLFIIFAGSATTLLYNFFADILRSLGNSKMPLIFLFFSCVLHIILNYLFIAGLDMGVAGAAFSSVISQAICVIMCVIYIKKRIPILNTSKSERKLCLKTIKELLSIGIPMAMTNFVVHFGVLILQFVTNGIGAAYVATYTLASRIGYMLTAPIFGVTNALSAFISQNWGAGKHERIRKAVFSSNLLLIITNTVILTLIFFFGNGAALEQIPVQVV
jgi:putative MATE family efflux protein